ncbi:hypothetical protein VNO77_27682 [Canavalia gladiata]|uniref:Uncharacterized protein n=1 Tax=Canavalia gladiata TaxID=3824 RepID=A0AAN9KYA8_CANGL
MNIPNIICYDRIVGPCSAMLFLSQVGSLRHSSRPDGLQQHQVVSLQLIEIRDLTLGSKQFQDGYRPLSLNRREAKVKGLIGSLRNKVLNLHFQISHGSEVCGQAILLLLSKYTRQHIDLNYK